MIKYDVYRKYNVKFHSGSGNQTDLLQRLKKTKLAQGKRDPTISNKQKKQSNKVKKKGQYTHEEELNVNMLKEGNETLIFLKWTENIDGMKQ
jgi:hypothetical protein